jgi:hypothetical protein
VARADVIAAGSCDTNGGQFNGAATNYVTLSNDGDLYLFYVDRLLDTYYTKSATAGLSWRTPISVFAGSVFALSSWYARWSNLADDKIYSVYTESGGSDILFRTLDTVSGALGTQTTVFAGTSAVQPAGSLSMCLDRAGNIRVVGSIDAGAEDGAWSSTDGGATWGDTIADPSEGATQDQYYALPGWNADLNDFMVIFVDASTNGLSVKRYDDSANTWAESVIIADGGFADLTAGNGYPNVACCVDIANSRNIVVAWTAADALNADLRLFFVNDTTVTESAANVVLNSTDDQGLCAVGLDTSSGTIYVFYGGKSDGSETFATAINIYYKTTTDNGATWSSETLLTDQARGIFWLACTPRFTSSTNWAVAYQDDLPTDQIRVNVTIPASGGGLATSMFDGGVIS